MVITSLSGEPAPVLLGTLPPEPVMPAAAFEWVEDENAALRDLPTDFGPRNASTLVSEFPTRIDQVIETANTFTSVNDAARWFATWPGVSGLSPQVLDPGAARNANPAVAALAQADEAEVTNWTRPGFGTPSDIQYVVRTGNTVVSLEVIGGERVTDVSTVSLARAALNLVVRECAGLLDS
jgi:hypothetical protein